MTRLNLNDLDPADLLPTPEVPESYGPRNAEDLRVHQIVKEALDSGTGKKYKTAADLMDAVREKFSR